ncbi:MAG: YiiD C-terminal domain-containing protein [Nevskia sp.]|nr:YiiD C-terminal domain-containing protein [Nevskia sp.]
MSPDDLTAYLHIHIPLTAALGARVMSFDSRQMEIAAPLAPNRNHRGTAFGGSLATLGILGGWSLLNTVLERQKLVAKIVVQHSDCEFREPVAADFTALSVLPEAEWPRFLTTLRRHRRARIAIETQIRANGRAVVTHRGRYAAFLESPLESPNDSFAPET